MKKLIFILPVLVIVLTSCSKPQGDTNADKRKYALQMRTDTIAELYAAKPEAKEKIAKASGYGVFSNININLLLLSSGNGYGIVRNNADGEDTYMKMRSLGIGLGAGAKDFRAVIIFKSPEALNTFTEKGWEWGGQADATARSDDKGGQLNTEGNIAADMEVYNFTENGIALQATVSGTKYWKDKELN